MKNQLFNKPRKELKVFDSLSRDCLTGSIGFTTSLNFKVRSGESFGGKERLFELCLVGRVFYLKLNMGPQFISVQLLLLCSFHNLKLYFLKTLLYR